MLGAPGQAQGVGEVDSAFVVDLEGEIGAGVADDAPFVIVGSQLGVDP